MQINGGRLSVEYMELRRREMDLSKQLVEFTEAIRVAQAACSASNDVLNSLNKANSWATFNEFTEGGLKHFYINLLEG